MYAVHRHLHSFPTRRSSDLKQFSSNFYFIKYAYLLLQGDCHLCSFIYMVREWLYFVVYGRKSFCVSHRNFRNYIWIILLSTFMRIFYKILTFASYLFICCFCLWFDAMCNISYGCVIFFVMWVGW